MLSHYDETDLPPNVAMGLQGDVVECQFCDTNWEINFDGLDYVLGIHLQSTKSRARYPGNYNPNLQKNIRRTNKLRKLLLSK